MSQYFDISISFSLVHLRCVSVCLFSICSFKTKLPFSPQRERRYFLAVLPFFAVVSVLYKNRFTMFITILVQCNMILYLCNNFAALLQRGKTVPEELVRAEDLSKYRQVASHAVSMDFCLLNII